MIIILLIIGLGTALLISGLKSCTFPAVSEKDVEYTLVIDPGHGGIDGGAISDSGIKESDINLNISLKMQAMADFLGIKNIMTRSTDTDFSNGADYNEHNNLVRRADIVNETNNAVLISIHQNKFPSGLVKGAEVMYADTDKSESLGLTIQDNIISFLDKENRRVARPAPENLLLTSSVNAPAVLIECGFMSNVCESELLNTDKYQLKLAEIIMASYMQFLNSNYLSEG